jgi:hypothetical protein
MNDKKNDKVLGNDIILGKQPDGKKTLKISIKNHALGTNHKYRRVCVASLSSQESRSWQVDYQ